MKYPDGQVALVGVRVVLSNGKLANFGFSIDTEEYADEFAKEDCEFLESGVLIVTDGGELIHCQDPKRNFLKLDESMQ